MLPMQADPIFEWQRLTEHYRQMSEGELLALAGDLADLTETAQQALRSEMHSRGLGDPESTRSAPALQSVPKEPPQAPLALENAPWAGDPVDIAFGVFGARPPELVPDTPNPDDEDNGPHDYTWKTVLCDCDTPEEAWQLSGALKQAGIESWIDGPRPRSGYTSFDLPNPRVLVAADQLDQARAVAARSIPPEIVEESETKVPDFMPPPCPKCGAGDPVLEGIDPVNSWRCEQCGELWSESVPTGDEQPPKAGKSPF